MNLKLDSPSFSVSRHPLFISKVSLKLYKCHLFTVIQILKKEMMQMEGKAEFATMAFLSLSCGLYLSLLARGSCIPLQNLSHHGLSPTVLQSPTRVHFLPCYLCDQVSLLPGPCSEPVFKIKYRCLCIVSKMPHNPD